MSGLPKGLIPVLSGANFVIGMGAFLVIGALGPLARDLELSPARAGWVMTSYALAYAVLSPLLVSATGGLGRRRVMALGMAVFA
ncbi:MAG: MFS transporter, partial [Jannaschia sp.]